MKDYTEYSVADVISLVIDYRGKTPKKLGSDWSKAGYRALSAKNIKTGKIVQEDSIRFVDEDLYHKWMKDEVQREDILITSEAPFGQIYYWDSEEKIVLSQRLFAIRINESFYPKYIYFYMTSEAFQHELHSRATGTTVTGLRQPELLKCKLFAPDFHTQKKIGDFLWNLDEKINLNERLNKNLEQQADALYQAYFSPKSGTQGEIVTLGEYCSIFTGKKNANASVEDGKYKFFTCAPDALQIDSYIYDGNAIIVSGNGAYTGRTRFYSGKFDLYQRTYACTLYDSINPDYIFPLYWFVKLELSKKIMGGTRGSAIPYIVMNDLAKFEFIYNEETFATYMPVFKCLTETIQANEFENEQLAKIRDTLLPQLMSGELDVSDLSI